MGRVPVLATLLIIATSVGCSGTGDRVQEGDPAPVPGTEARSQALSSRAELVAAWRSGQKDRATLVGIHNATLEPGCRDGIDVLEEAFRANPNDRQVLNWLGVQYMVQGQLEAALTYLEMATTEFASSEALANRARVQLRLGKAVDAKGSIDRYEVQSGRDVVAQRLRAQLELLNGDLDKALAHMREAARLSSDPITTRELADMLVRCKKNDEAVDLYESLIAAGAPGAAVRGNLAYALLASEQLEEAIDMAESALEIDPAYAPAWRTLGRAQTKLEKYDDALESLEHALAHSTHTSPMAIRVHYSIGEAQLAKGKTREACNSYWRALELIDPDGKIRAGLPGRGTFPLETEAELMHKHLGEFLDRTP